MMSSRWLLLPLKTLIAGGLLWWLTDSGRMDLAPLAEKAPGPIYVVGFLIYCLSFLPQSVRWWWLLGAQKVEIALIRIIQWTLIGGFFGLVLPGGAGTELARGYYVFRSSPNARTAALSTVVLDRIIGLFALVFLGVLAFLGLLADDAPLNINAALMGVAAVALFLGACLGFGLIGFSPSRRLILSLVPRRFAEPVNSMVYAYLHGKRAIAYGVILSVGAHLMLMGSFMIAGYILGTPLGWREVFLIVPLVTISNIIPISPAGIGIGEVTASFLFAQFDIANGAAIMFVVRMWMILSQLLGGLVYLFYRDSLSK